MVRGYDQASFTMRALDRLKTNAAAPLDPGEQLQAAIWAQTLNPYQVPLTPLRVLFGPSDPYRVIIASDRRLLLYGGNRWRVGAIRELLAELPRTTQIGPASGVWHRTDVFSERLYIQRRWYGEVAASDAAAW
jgi:hypothetical protein